MTTLYASVVNKGCAARFAFAAALFGEFSEALSWLQLPQALCHLLDWGSGNFLPTAAVSLLAPNLGNDMSSRSPSMETTISTDKEKDAVVILYAP